MGIGWVVKDRLLKANHNWHPVVLCALRVVKDRLLKANHNARFRLRLGSLVVKDRLLKANHNKHGLVWAVIVLSKIVY